MFLLGMNRMKRILAVFWIETDRRPNGHKSFKTFPEFD